MGASRMGAVCGREEEEEGGWKGVCAEGKYVKEVMLIGAKDNIEWRKGNAHSKPLTVPRQWHLPGRT